ncbi:acyltransferase family protein [Massilia sp. SR12]
MKEVTNGIFLGEVVTEKASIVWVDYMRVIATLGVVLLHSAAPLLYKFNELPPGYWWYGNLYDSMVRMCVPLFFMISGCLLLGKQEPLLDFFKKRVNKVVVPLLAWSLLYIFWKAYVEETDGLSFYSFYSIALSPAYYHLWFLYAIIGVYLYLPILRLVVAHSGQTLLNYYLLLWFVAVAVIPFGEKISKIGSKIDLLSISGFSGFLVFGYCLAKLKISRGRALVAGMVFLAMVALTACGTYQLTSMNKGQLVDYLYGYLAPNVIVMAASFFIVAKYAICETRLFSTPSAEKVIGSLSSASFGIYLIHAALLSVLNSGALGFVLNGASIHPVLSVPATAILAFMLSYMVILAIRGVPLLRKIAP